MTVQDPAERFLGRPWSDLETHWSAVIAEVESTVVEWAWTPIEISWDTAHLLSSEKHGNRPQNRRLAAPPTDPGDGVLCGWDADGIFVLARSFYPATGEWDDKIWLPGLNGERVLLRFRRTSEQRASGPREVVMSVQILRNGDPEEVRSFRRHDESGQIVEASVEAYTRDDSGGVTGIHFESSQDRYRIDVTNDDAGEPAVLTLYRNDAEPTVLYRKAPAKEVKAALRSLENEFPVLIAAWVDRQPVAGAPYAIFLLYDPDNPSLPPALAVGANTDLQSLKQRYGTLTREVIWNPAEMARFDAEPAEFADDPRLRESCEIVSTHWRSTFDDEAVRRFLVKVAKRLRDDPALMGGRPDVAVLAVDLELEHLERNLKALVPKRVREAVEAASLLPGD